VFTASVESVLIAVFTLDSVLCYFLCVVMIWYDTSQRAKEAALTCSMHCVLRGVGMLVDRGGFTGRLDDAVM
jgi:uncharacterized membrane protein (GlpM family)